MSLAREYSCSFFETSAALRFYIDDVFHGLVREIRRKESSLTMAEKKMKRRDSLWRKLKGSLRKKQESTTWWKFLMSLPSGAVHSNLQLKKGNINTPSSRADPGVPSLQHSCRSSSFLKPNLCHPVAPLYYRSSQLA